MMKKIFVVLLMVLFSAAQVGRTQEEPRRIWAEAYSKKVKSAQKPATKRAKKREYKSATPQIVADAVVPETVVGITIWRFRPTREGELGTEIGTERLVAERVDASTVLSSGDKVRISIEAARDGYLYVINREQYADGTSGEPYLIFPTSRLTGGVNQTTVGRVFFIPAHSDQPPYFTLTPGRPDQIGELISVLVTPEPITGVKMENKEVQLSGAQVTEWEKKWGKTVGRLEMQGGSGEPITAMELEAGAGARLLKHTDPPPQSVYYNPEISATDPVFINVNLKYQDL